MPKRPNRRGILNRERGEGDIGPGSVPLGRVGPKYFGSDGIRTDVSTIFRLDRAMDLANISIKRAQKYNTLRLCTSPRS